MGTFAGHALPGTFFILFGLWWTVQTYRRYFSSVRKGRPAFRATATYMCDCLPGSAKKLQWEGILKVFFTTVGFTGEIVTAFKDGEFRHYGNGQHATMFFFFGLSGVIDIIIHHRPSLLPKGVDYMIGILSFSVEGLLFAFHTHGRTDMDKLIHTLLVYSIMLCILCSILELKYKNNVLLPLARSYGILLQGTWFWQAGFILYPPSSGSVWDQDNHEQMMIVTMMFAWHMAAIFLLILFIGFIVQISQRCCCRNQGQPGNHGYDQVRLLSVTTETGEDINRNSAPSSVAGLSNGKSLLNRVDEDDEFNLSDNDTLTKHPDIVS